jgi:hypothetical protein
MLIFLTACLPDSSRILLQDSQNYAFSSSIQAESTSTALSQDVRVDWSDLGRDMMGLEMDPSEISKLSVLLFPRLSQAEVLFGLGNETLRQADLSGYAELEPEPGRTSAWLSSFSIQGVHVDPSEHLSDENGSYLLTAASADGETRMLAFLSPLAGEEVQEVLLHAGSASVDFDAGLSGQDLVPYEPSQRYLLDWSGLTASGTGAPLNLGQLDLLTLARFDETLAELEEGFLLLSSLAEAEYAADVAGAVSQDLSALEDEAGRTFPGFVGEGVWLVALRCSRCVNPSPLFVGVVSD